MKTIVASSSPYEYMEEREMFLHTGLALFSVLTYTIPISYLSIPRAVQLLTAQWGLDRRLLFLSPPTELLIGREFKSLDEHLKVLCISVEIVRSEHLQSRQFGEVQDRWSPWVWGLASPHRVPPLTLSSLSPQAGEPSSVHRQSAGCLLLGLAPWKSWNCSRVQWILFLEEMSQNSHAQIGVIFHSHWFGGGGDYTLIAYLSVIFHSLHSWHCPWFYVCSNGWSFDFPVIHWVFPEWVWVKP